MVAGFVIAAALGPWLAPYEPIASATDVDNRFLSPSAAHWLGTDHVGTDMLSAMLHGTRIALLVSVLVVALCATVGTTVGIIAGYYRGIVDGVLMRIVDTERSESLGNSNKELLNVINVLLYKLDVIPAGLVLGQAAYESGYGTSRFAVQGNALFGQWTYGGKGLKPEQQRKELGDHRIASFDWPFDSVRGYYINLSSHPAYEDFRRLRAERKASGEPLTSMALADGLIAYSERGQEYIDTLKGIMRVNGLTIADDAIFRDEPIRFFVGAKTDADASALRADIERMRATGELDEIISRMRLK